MILKDYLEMVLPITDILFIRARRGDYYEYIDGWEVDNEKGYFLFDFRRSDYKFDINDAVVGHDNETIVLDPFSNPKWSVPSWIPDDEKFFVSFLMSEAIKVNIL